MTIIKIHLQNGQSVSFLKSLPIDNLIVDTQRFLRTLKRYQEPPDHIPTDSLIAYARIELNRLKQRFDGLIDLAKALPGDTETMFLAYYSQVEKYLKELTQAN